MIPRRNFVSAKFIPEWVHSGFHAEEIFVLIWHLILVSCKMKTNSVPRWNRKPCSLGRVAPAYSTRNLRHLCFKSGGKVAHVIPVVMWMQNELYKLINFITLYRATFSANQKKNQSKSWLIRARFSALRAGYMYWLTGLPVSLAIGNWLHCLQKSLFRKQTNKITCIFLTNRVMRRFSGTNSMSMPNPAKTATPMVTYRK